MPDQALEFGALSARPIAGSDNYDGFAGRWSYKFTTLRLRPSDKANVVPFHF